MKTEIVEVTYHPLEPTPDPNEKKLDRLEAKYYIVAIITMILSVIIAFLALFMGSEKTETEVTQGSNSENTVINGDNNIVNQGYITQENNEICEDPLTFQSDDLRLAYTADLMEQGSYNDAIAFLRKCLRLSDLSEEMKSCVNYNLGLCLLTTGTDYNQAATHLAEAANQVKQAEIYYYLCHAYMRAERFTDALNAIDQAIELDNDQTDYQTLRDKLISGAYTSVA